MMTENSPFFSSARAVAPERFVQGDQHDFLVVHDQDAVRCGIG
jgi:hypothetical protein